MKPTTIVLVGHDDDACAVLRRVCDAPGFLIAEAFDADAAAAYIERHTAAAVILPRQHDDAYGWIARLRQLGPEMLIIVTGDGDDLTVLDAGADIVLASMDEALLASALQLICARDAPIAPEGRISLVVVEPDPLLAGVMLRWLGGSYNVRVVATGWRAIELVREEVPDAILAELRLPDMDAAELHAAVQRMTSGLADRILFMTAGFVADRAQQFLARMPGQSISKPFDLQRLRAALVRMFD